MMGSLRREDEQKLKELTNLCERVGRHNLPEDDQLTLLFLEDRYNYFLEEGMRKLRGEDSYNNNNNNNNNNNFDRSFSRSFPRLLQNGFTKKENIQIKNTTFPSSESPAENNNNNNNSNSNSSNNNNEKQVITKLFNPTPTPNIGKLWTWVTNQIIIGGIPRAGGNIFDNGAGHLLDLSQQCEARAGTICFVISCLEIDEIIPDGFANIKDWEMYTDVLEFIHFPCIPSVKLENPPEISDNMMEELLMLCINIQNICSLASYGEFVEFHNNNNNNNNNKTRTKINYSHSVIHFNERKRRFLLNSHQSHHHYRPIVYIMCKTGETRSWVLAMAYFMSQHDMEFTNANIYLQQLRNFQPSKTQEKVILQFADFLRNPRRNDKSEEEQMYIEVLAQVLSLAPVYRERLLRDLSALT